MQINTVQFFYFNEQVHKDIIILYSEKEKKKTFHNFEPPAQQREKPVHWTWANIYDTFD